MGSTLAECSMIAERFRMDAAGQQRCRSTSPSEA